MSPVATETLLTRARAALERGLGGDVTRLLQPVLRRGPISRDDELEVRCLLAQAWLLQGDLGQAAIALGRPPDTIKESLDDGLLSSLWRLHGQVALGKGESSRAIALQQRALRHAERARDSKAIGLAHLELAHCYRAVGDSAIPRDHLTRAAAALHAAGARRDLALVHSLSGVLLAQAGRNREAMAVLRQGERLAQEIHAEDVLARLLHNQANVALVQHEREHARALAERSVALYESVGPGHGLSVALATLGQVLVQLGDVERAERVLTRSLEVRGQVKFQETTVGVFDTLTQIHLMRGAYDRAEAYLDLARDAYERSSSPTVQWYQWSLRVLAVRLAIKRREFDVAIAMADALTHTEGPPVAERLQADMAATEALVALGQTTRAQRRLESCQAMLDARGAPSSWGAYLRIRGLVHEAAGDAVAAHHDFAQSVSIFDLLGERYSAAVGRLALGRLAHARGAFAAAHRHVAAASEALRALGAHHDLEEATVLATRIATSDLSATTPLETDADDALVRRLVEGAAFPDLLSRELVAAIVECCEVEDAVVFTYAPDGDISVATHAGQSHERARMLAVAAHAGERSLWGNAVVCEPLGRSGEVGRFCAVHSSRPLPERVARRLATFAAVARQGFELCTAREQHSAPAEAPVERSLEPLLPGFICAGPAMSKLAEDIQRLQAHDLTVLITGESGTGKDLVARAVHLGSHRRNATFLPYNCTSVSRELADSQLFGHRRGSFTGAITDQPGLVRTASGGTLLLDEIGDLPIDVQPKLLRFLEQGEILPVGDARPLAVDVRVIAATNVDLEQRVADGRFREDLYYRLSVIHVHVPPLRERLEEIPHLTTFFLRDASDRLGKPDVRLSSSTLDVFSHYRWPGNVRQLRNEIQRAVAMTHAGGMVEPSHLSPDLSTNTGRTASERTWHAPSSRLLKGPLSAAVGEMEKTLIVDTLDRAGGNVAESARVLGLTRRGLYLKMKRLGLGASGAHTK